MLEFADRVSSQSDLLCDSGVDGAFNIVLVSLNGSFSLSDQVLLMQLSGAWAENMPDCTRWVWRESDEIWRRI